MTTKYSDIIKLRGQKAAYNIQTEEDGAWSEFITNEQFNDILRKVINSVYNNDTNVHKSFWIEGTYGTGKSHAAAVIKHLLCDPVSEILEYVNEEYANPNYDVLKNSIFNLRSKKRLFPVTMYGQNKIAHKDDLSLQIQGEIKKALLKANIDLDVKTDFDNYVSHIKNNSEMWELILEKNPKLSSFTPTTDKLILDLSNQDSGTLSRVKEVLRDTGIDIRLETEMLSDWFFEVQNKLALTTDYDGILLIWDEFTDVMKSDIGLSILVEIQRLADETMNTENNSYLFFISHPDALNSLKAEEREKTKGRYIYMRYNMEPTSAFKIMSRKFKLVGTKEELQSISTPFYDKCASILNTFIKDSSNPNETLADIKKLFPVHPATANLATYYAREAGSSTRSVFQFLGENEAIKNFLNDENKFLNRETITADYLWDYVVTEFYDNVSRFGAITERFNSYRLRVKNEGSAYLAVFKSVLLLNALNNIANNETVTPSEENIKNLYIGTSIEYNVDNILSWFNENSIVQRAPGGMYSIQFSALPPNEIEDIKNNLMLTDFKTTAQVINFGTVAYEEFERCLANVARPYSFQLYSIDVNEYTLLNKIENGRRNAKDYELFIAMFVARNTAELHTLKDIANCNCSDVRFNTTTFIVFDSVLTDANYNRFIEYQANSKCAQQHGFADQQQSHSKLASDMLKEWIKEIRRGVFETYINGKPINMSVQKLPTFINSTIAPTIFSAGPESLELIKVKFSKTYWNKVFAKETVKNILSYNTKQEILDRSKGAANHIQYLLQDSVNEDLTWKTDINPEHPLLKVSQFVEKKIKYADKSNNFNLSEKFIELTRPPYGLFPSHAGMGMLAFAMRPYIGKIFDLNGKPREAQHLVEDVVEVFKSWENGKTSQKVTFRFETPEEGKLCKSFIRIFNLTNYKGISEISSLKNARWVITHSYVPDKKYPLWSLKYLPDEIAKPELKKLVENINSICVDIGSSNPSLFLDTLEGIKNYEFEFKNLINAPDNFRKGFLFFLQTEKNVKLKDDEFDNAFQYISQNLQSELGMWNESEVINALLKWRVSTKNQPTSNTPIPGQIPIPSPVPLHSSTIHDQKRQSALDKVDSITEIYQAKSILQRLINLGYDIILDIILNN
jgi:hypothetical protein